MRAHMSQNKSRTSDSGAQKGRRPSQRGAPRDRTQLIDAFQLPKAFQLLRAT